MIRILFFAGLAETIGRREAYLAYPGPVDVAGVWVQVVGTPRPDRLRCARNQAHCDFGTAVHDGDEVAFFPPVTGG